MNNLSTIMSKFCGKCAMTIALFVATTGLALASMGPGIKSLDDHKNKKPKSLLSSQAPSSNFSLKSGYQYRGNQVITFTEPKVIDLNTKMTYQKGNTTYTVPLKKKIVVDNIKFGLSL